MASLTELFQADPFGLTDSDVDEIIKYYRERYAEHVATGKPIKEKLDIEKSKDFLKEAGLL